MCQDKTVKHLNHKQAFLVKIKISVVTSVYGPHTFITPDLSEESEREKLCTCQPCHDGKHTCAIRHTRSTRRDSKG